MKRSRAIVAVCLGVQFVAAHACQSAMVMSPDNSAVFPAPADFSIDVQVVGGFVIDEDGTQIAKRINTISLYQDGALLSQQSIGGLTGTVNRSFAVSDLPAGTHLYKVVATCLPGSATSPEYTFYSNVPPTVSLSSPANGSVFAPPANVVLSATASDTGGSINSVEFRSGQSLIASDAQAPYSVQWSNLAPGTYTYFARAIDNVNSRTDSQSRSFRVNALPSVTLTSPAPGAVDTKAPGTFTLVASPSDSDGTIAKVEFLNGTTVLATVNSAPWSYSWTGAAAGTYSLSARATDNDGGITKSSPVAVRVNADPVVSLLSPSDGAVAANAPGSFTLNSSVSDSDGTISKIEYLNGATVIATLTAAPWTYTWSGVAAGSYSLSARVTDNNGATSVSGKAIVRVNAAPAVTMTSPTAGAVDSQAPGNFTLTASASDSDGSLATLEFLNGSSVIATLTTAPWTYAWSGAAVGSYSLSARATDNDGAVKTSAAVGVRVNAAPTITITSPKAGDVAAVAPGSFSLASTVSDADGSVTKVEYLEGSTVIATVTSTPWTYVWTGVPEGNHTLTARATDNNGAVKVSGGVTVRVNDPPTVALTSPSSGAVAPGFPGSFVLTAAVSDTDGTVGKVEFLSGSNILATLTSAPWSFTWNDVPAGSYSLTARATDNNAARQTSAAVNVRVNAPPPSVSVSVPASVYASPATFVVSAVASSPLGIQRVEFLRNGTLVATDTQSPYQATSTSLPVGNYTFTAVAYDASGTSSSSAGVVVKVSQAPTVSISSPPSGLMANLGETVQLAASAVDPDGTISKVEFYDDAKLLGQATYSASKYTYSWSPSVGGARNVTAVATDSSGVKTTSAPVRIEIVGASNIAPPNITDSDLAGALTGTASVGPSGAASYSVSIAVPPGTAGVQPALGLAYVGHAGHGLLGRGWTLTGFSTISRCDKTKVQDGLYAQVTLTAQDAFCLDGQRLIQISGTHGANAEYRTEIDSFSKVVSFGSDPAKGPDRWEVWTRSGLILSYGSTADSEVPAQGRSPAVVLAWALSRAADRKGNYYAVVYGSDTLQGAHWPVQVSYTGNSTSAPYNAVRFEYVDRTEGDVLQAWVAGAKVSVSKQLRNIKSYINIASDGSGGTLVRDLRVSYTQSSTSGRSLVASLQDCSGTGACLPSTTFSWSTRSASHNNMNANGSGVWGGPAAISILEPISGTPEDKAADIAGQIVSQVVQGDFDGDGKADMTSSSGNGQWRVCLSAATAFQCSNWAGLAVRSDLAYFGDFNGDGRTDVAAPGTVAGATPWRVCLSTGTAFACEDWASYFIGGVYQNVVVGDFDGDGRDDLVMGRTNSSEKLCISTGSAAAGFVCKDYAGVGDALAVVPNPTGFEEVPRNASPAAIDIDGDGKAEIIKTLTLGGLVHTTVYLATTTGFVSEGVIARGTVNAYQFPTAGGSWFSQHNEDPLAAYVDWIVSQPNTSTPSSSTVSYCQRARPVAATLLPNIAQCAELPITSASVEDFKNETFSDVDGDGRPDGFHWDMVRNVWRVCQVNSKGTSYTCADWGSAVDVDAYAARYFGDFNGDGKIDVALYDRAAGSWNVRLADGPAPDLLVSVKDGVGLEHKFVHRPLTDPTIYTKDSGELQATLPQKDVQIPMQVVSTSSISNGLGGYDSTTWQYGGMKLEVGGRGSLGYRWIRQTRAETGQQVYTEASQTFPFTGQPVKTIVTAGNGATLRDSTTTLAKRVTASSKVFHPFASSTVEVTRDLNGADLGTATATVDPVAGYDAYGNLLKRVTVSSLGTATSTSEDSNVFDNIPTNWLIGQLRRSVTIKTSDTAPSVARTVSFDYNAIGRMTRRTVEPDSPQLRVQTDIGYDGFGNAVSKSLSWLDPRSTTSVSRTVESLTFDTRGRFPVESRNALSHRVLREFNEAHGGVTRLQDANDLVTSWQYDAWGRRVREDQADNTSSTWAYRSCVTGCNGGTSVVVAQKWAGSSQIASPTETITDVLGRTVRGRSWAYGGVEKLKDQSFDLRGNLSSASRPYSASSSPVWTRFEYDELGRRVAVIAPNDTGGVETTTIDYNGTVVTTTDPRNRTRKSRTNFMGLVDQVTDPASQKITYGFDAWGNLTSSTDALGNIIKVEYDAWGRRTVLRDPDLGVRVYQVDPLGQIWRQTDAKGQVTEHWYDDLGRRTRRYAIDQDARYVYDTAVKGKGQLAEAYTLLGGGSKDYRRVHSYDSIGRPSSTTTTLDEDYSQRFTYTPQGRLGTSRLERNTVGATGGPGVTFSYAYEANGYLAQIKSDLGGTTLDWTVASQDVEDRLLEERLGNGVSYRRAYGAGTGLVQTLRADQDGSGSALLDDSYTYDNAGRLTQRVQRVATGGDLLVEQFAYDSRDRITSAEVIGQAASTVTYNAIGNIATKSGVGSYTYPSSGATSVRPHAVARITGTVNGVVNPSFSYDANGNLLAGAGRTHTWTSFDAPASMDNGTVSSTWAYGAEQQRARMVTLQGGQSISIYYAGGIEKEVVNGTTLTRWYMPRGLGFLQTSSATAGVDRRYVLRDTLGSATVMTGESGEQLARLSYDAWGKRRNLDGSADPTNSLRNPLDHQGYTGHEHLESLGLIHMNGRVYDPLLGRMITADPSIPDSKDLQSLNRYSYVVNNPLGFTDPTGYTPLSQRVFELMADATDPAVAFKENAREDSRMFGALECKHAPQCEEITGKKLPGPTVAELTKERYEYLKSFFSNTDLLKAGTTFIVAYKGQIRTAAVISSTAGNILVLFPHPLAKGAGYGLILGAKATNAVVSSVTAEEALGDADGSGADSAAGGASPPPEDEDSKRDLTPEEKKAIKSYEKRIAQHEQKLAEFKANPTVRPGMEDQPQEVIQRQQAVRVQHLETEIRTFRANIDKITNGR